MSTVQLPIKQIEICDAIQARVSVSQDTVDEYADAIREGAEFPAIVVFFDGHKHWLAAGFHRVPSHKLAGRACILAEVRQGSKRDAMLFAVGDNTTHGRPRSNEDKRKAVEMLLEDEEWFQWADREIARRCHVSHMLVSTIRREMQLDSHRDDSKRKCADVRKTYTVPKKKLEAVHNRMCMEKVVHRLEQAKAKLAETKGLDVEVVTLFLADAQDKAQAMLDEL